MTWVAVAELAVIVVLLLLRERDRAFLERVVRAAARERVSLLDRIQHPHVRQVDVPQREVDIEPAKDADQMALVGQILYGENEGEAA